MHVLLALLLITWIINAIGNVIQSYKKVEECK